MQKVFVGPNFHALIMKMKCYKMHGVTEPLCVEVGAQFYLFIVFLMSGGRGRAMVFSYQSIPLGACV